MKYHIYCEGQRITDRNSPMELSATQVKHYEMTGYRLEFDKISDEAIAKQKKCYCHDCVQFGFKSHPVY